MVNQRSMSIALSCLCGLLSSREAAGQKNPATGYLGNSVASSVASVDRFGQGLRELG
jgi:hypothetical protein